ncbi:MAG: TIGR02281 family clan AA aspartic protease [Gammaproteobacteria bacterium]|nr:MAG: TIGR02281 family clan AA aspartic protease [Gammaproteobacteria bacterium]
MPRLTMILLLTLVTGVANAAQVRVLALFPGKAMLEVDGRRKVLSDGERLDGVRLIAATPSEARVEIGGRIERLRLGGGVASRFATPAREEIRLLRQGNAFYVDGLINGQPVRMLVDTGASTVALSERDARRLGIPYVAKGQGAQVQTASGTARAFAVRLKSLKLGTRTFRNVQAMVVEGDYPRNVLLGMNVIGAFEVDHRGNLMILRARH